MCVYMSMTVGHFLATNILIGELPAKDASMGMSDNSVG